MGSSVCLQSQQDVQIRCCGLLRRPGPRSWLHWPWLLRSWLRWSCWCRHRCPCHCHHRLRCPHCRRQVCSLRQRCQHPRPLQRWSRPCCPCHRCPRHRCPCHRCPCHRRHRCDRRLLHPRRLLRQEGG